jgi:hypothetical protein
MTTSRRFESLLFRAGTLVCLSAVFAICAFAQTNKASIVGSVTDTNGATVSGAKVTVTNVETNATREATTDADGNFDVPLLDIGHYTVSATAPNFQTVTQENVTLQTADRQRVDISLPPGDVGAEVTVTTAPPLVETETSERGSVITGREVTELPLSGRNFTQLATLAPGVVRASNVFSDARQFNNGDPRAGGGGPGGSNENGGTETSRFSRSGGASLSANGQRPTNNNFSVDGVDNNEPQFGGIGQFSNPDAIAEFKVTTSIPTADVGRASGAVVNATIKSGTNEFHGSAYYYGQQSALNAYHPVLKTKLAEAQDRNASPIELASLKKAVQHVNEFGGTIGGPIIKNKSFFFFDYGGGRNNLPFPADSVVPTLKSRTGDFSDFTKPILDPRTGQPFANNVIPSNRIDPVGKAYLNAYPAPNRNVLDPSDSLLQRNFYTQRANQETINNYEFKIDHRVSSNNSLTGRYSDQKLFTTRANLLPNLPTAGFGAGEEHGDSRQLSISDTHTFSPTILNEFRFGLTTIDISILNCGVGGACGVSPTFAKDIGIPNSNDGSLAASGGALIGNFGTGFLEFTGDGGLFQVKSKNPYFADTVTIIKGNQSLRLGGEARLRNINEIDGGRAGGLKGQFQYGDEGPLTGQNDNCPAGSGTPEACYVAPDGVPFGGSGNGQANILLGLPARFVSKGSVFGGPFALRSQEYGFFVQDDWKVNDRLTLNLGLRYDIFTPFTERNGRIGNFDIASRQVIVASGSGDRIVKTDKNNFGPRIGFAYSVNNEKTIVLRGGYGLIYTTDGVDYPPEIRNPPFSNSIGIDQTGTTRTTNFTLASGPPSVPGPVDPANVPVDFAVFSIDPSQKTAYVHQFQFGGQWQFAKDYSLDVAYVGNRSRNLLYSYDSGLSGTAQAVNRAGEFLNNAQFYTNGAQSSYDGLQTQVQKRFSSNIQGQISYTWSHTIDNSTGVFNGLGDARGNKNGPVNPLNINQDKGNSSLDVRHLLSADAIIDVPFGKGRRYFNSSAVADKILGGIQLNIIESARSGFPYSVSCNCGLGRPSLIGDPFANLQPGRVLNRLAFSTEDPYLASVKNAAGKSVPFGTLGRNTFRGPAIYNTDFSIFKNTGITEGLRTQIGLEFFNVFNHANYTVPQNKMFDSDFGQLKSAYPGRVVQYRVKVLF